MAKDDPIRFDNWSQGANNMASEDRLPEGFVRSLVNLDPGAGGNIDLRSGYEKVVDVAGIRACYAIGQRVLIVAEGGVMSYDAATDSSSDLGPALGEGVLSGVEHNGQLYFSTLKDSLRSDGYSLKQWGIPEPAYSVEAVDAGGLTGTYKVAVTALVGGVESGASIFVLTLAGQSLRITSADTRALRVYVSAPDASSLYYQGVLARGELDILKPVDDSAQLESGWMMPFPHCTQLTSYHGVILGAGDGCLYISEPLRPHLIDISRGFFQYPVTPNMVVASDGGVYVSADRVYFLTELEGAQPAQRVVSEYPAVAGTGVKLPDGRCAWFTRYGQAVGDQLGQVQMLNAGRYAPAIAARGTAGYLDHNGNSLVVTTMRGQTESNNLATGDFAELEM